MNRMGDKGFTIVELMISSSIFAVILLGASATLTQIGKMYYKGVISSRTQNVGRTTMDDISRSIQFSGEDVIVDASKTVNQGTAGNQVAVRAFCVGTDRYTYALNGQIDDNITSGRYEISTNRLRHGLWKDNLGAAPSSIDDCHQNLPDLTSELTSGQELLDQYMRVGRLDIGPGQDGLWPLSLTIIYGDNDLLDNPSNPTACKGQAAGSQWCATSKLSTQVYKRIE